MKKRRWSDGWFAAALVLTALHCAAQDSFRYRAQVDTPHETDFYRIVLSPEVVARSKTDLSDLRILGADGRFIPYVLKEEAADSGGAYQAIPDAAILQKDSSNRHSYVTLTWHANYRIDRLSLKIGYPTLYKRHARIYSQMPDGSWSPVAQVSIDPRDTVFHIPGVRTRGVRIDIDNADNAPLRIVGVSAMQAGIFLLTWLQNGSSYLLLTGDPKAGAPQYDPGYFTDSLTRRPREVGIGPGQESVVMAGGPSSPQRGPTAKPGGGFLLWSILSTVLLLLIYFSVKMVGAIGAKKGPHDRV